MAPKQTLLVQTHGAKARTRRLTTDRSSALHFVGCAPISRCLWHNSATHRFWQPVHHEAAPHCLDKHQHT